MKAYYFDIEADGLLPEWDRKPEDTISRVHCAVVLDLISHEIFKFDPSNINELCALLGQADLIFGHNSISYDLPALKYVFPNEYNFHLSWVEGQEGIRIFDTMVLSRLIWPDIQAMDYENMGKKSIELPPGGRATKELIGSHSLRAWGYRLSYFKGNSQGEVDFHTYTPEMFEYCKRDVLLSLRLFELIMVKEPEWYQDLASPPFHVYLEHQFYRYLQYQQSAGVQFDGEFAEYLVNCWQTELSKRIAEMRTMVPDILKETTITPKVNNSKLGYVKGVPFLKRQVIPFNPKSGDHVIAFLINKYGWVPTVFTKKKNPEVSYDVLKNLPYREAPLLARIRLLVDRIRLVKTGPGSLLKCQKPNGRIYGGIIHNGTNTSRCRHIKPNLGNIPAPKSIWGHALRKTFIPAEGYVLVGADAESLEMACLGEALWEFDGGAFYRMAFFGNKEDGTDPHSMNRKYVREELIKSGYSDLADKFTRDNAKTAFYAKLYGCWPKKLGQIATDGTGKTYQYNTLLKIGKLVEKGMARSVKGIDELQAKLEREYQECYDQKKWPHLKMPDGRLTPIRMKTALLNTRLQTMGAIIMKYVSVLLLNRLAESELGLPGLYWRPVLHVHDELQNEVKDERRIVSEFSRVVAECFEQAGRDLGFRVPIKGTIAVGKTWAETH